MFNFNEEQPTVKRQELSILKDFLKEVELTLFLLMNEFSHSILRELNY